MLNLKDINWKKPGLFAAGVAYKLGLTNSKVIVHMPGGELQVEVEDDWNVYMTGDVFYIAKVTLSNEFAERLRAL